MPRTKTVSWKSGGKAQSSRGEEETSDATRAYHLSRHEREILRDEEATKRYTSDFLNREILFGRFIDFEWLRKQIDVNIDLWMMEAGWADFLNVREVVYPKLVRILYANLDVNTMKSKIGNVEVDLNVHVWKNLFGLMWCEEEEERAIMEVSKDVLFKHLNGKENQGHKPWINSNELPARIDDRLLVNILMNGLIPKRGSREQLREEEARILYSVRFGYKYNIARDVIKRIQQVFNRKTTPLVYPMHLMVIMKEAGVNLKAAGDVKLEEIPPTMFINEKTPPRLGFKKEGNYWYFVGKGKGKFTGENIPGEEPVRPEEDRQEQGRDEEEHGAASSIPHTYTSYPTHTQQPHITHHLAVFETQLLSKITQIFDSRITHHLTQHLNPINSGLQFLNSRIDDLQTDLRTLANSIHNPFSPHSEPQPRSPFQPEPHPQPQPQPQPEPQPEPQPSTQPESQSTQPEPQSTSQPPPQTNIPFIDLTNPLNPPSYPADHFSTATYLDVPSPHPDIPPTEPHQYPAAHYSETSDSERTPSPQFSNQPTPSATPIPQLSAPRRFKQVAVRKKRILKRKSSEQPQDPTPPAISPAPAADVADTTPSRLQGLSNVFTRKKKTTSKPSPAKP